MTLPFLHILTSKCVTKLHKEMRVGLLEPVQELASNHLSLLKTVLFEVRGWKNHGALKEDLVEVSGLLHLILRSYSQALRVAEV